jgi:hypothetical protein
LMVADEQHISLRQLTQVFSTLYLYPVEENQSGPGYKAYQCIYQ